MVRGSVGPMRVKLVKDRASGAQTLTAGTSRGETLDMRAAQWLAQGHWYMLPFRYEDDGRGGGLFYYDVTGCPTLHDTLRRPIGGVQYAYLLMGILSVMEQCEAQGIPVTCVQWDPRRIHMAPQGYPLFMVVPTLGGENGRDDVVTLLTLLANARKVRFPSEQEQGYQTQLAGFLSQVGQAGAVGFSSASFHDFLAWLMPGSVAPRGAAGVETGASGASGAGTGSAGAGTGDYSGSAGVGVGASGTSGASGAGASGAVADDGGTRFSETRFGETVVSGAADAHAADAYGDAGEFGETIVSGQSGSADAVAPDVAHVGARDGDAGEFGETVLSGQSGTPIPEPIAPEASGTDADVATIAGASDSVARPAAGAAAPGQPHAADGRDAVPGSGHADAGADAVSSVASGTPQDDDDLDGTVLSKMNQRRDEYLYGVDGAALRHRTGADTTADAAVGAAPALETASSGTAVGAGNHADAAGAPASGGAGGNDATVLSTQPRPVADAAGAGAAPEPASAGTVHASAAPHGNGRGADMEAHGDAHASSSGNADAAGSPWAGEPTRPAAGDKVQAPVATEHPEPAHDTGATVTTAAPVVPELVAPPIPSRPIRPADTGSPAGNAASGPVPTHAAAPTAGGIPVSSGTETTASAATDMLRPAMPARNDTGVGRHMERQPMPVAGAQGRPGMPTPGTMPGAGRQGAPVETGAYAPVGADTHAAHAGTDASMGIPASVGTGVPADVNEGAYGVGDEDSEDATMLKPSARQTAGFVVRRLRDGREVAAHAREATIGRSKTADIHMGGNTNVSRIHATITMLDDGRFAITDHDSANGTSVGGRELASGGTEYLRSGGDFALADDTFIVRRAAVGGGI